MLGPLWLGVEGGCIRGFGVIGSKQGLLRQWLGIPQHASWILSVLPRLTGSRL